MLCCKDFSKHYCPFISVVNIYYSRSFHISWCLVSVVQDDTRYDRGETEARRYLPRANASYLPVSVFITRPTARPRLSDVRTRVSPNLQGAELSQHLFYISQFRMVQLRHTSSFSLGNWRLDTGGKAPSSFIIFTEGSVFCPGFSKNHPQHQHLIISRHGKLGRASRYSYYYNFNRDRNCQQNVAILELYLL